MEQRKMNPSVKSNNGSKLFSLISGVSGLLACMSIFLWVYQITNIYFLGIIFFAIVAIGAGHFALFLIKRNNGARGNKAIAILGLVLGYSLLIIAVGFFEFVRRL
jgi:hypothetical protein